MSYKRIAMEISNLIPHIESLIFASDKPLTAAEITELVNQAFGFMEDKIIVEQVEAAIDGIVEKYNSEFYPFEVLQSGGGWQFLTKKEFHKTVAQLNGEKFLKRLSAAALETLAIIAYKQPVTKGEIESIRGVSSDYAVQKLLEKELIVISGRNEKLPGHPLIYGTSKNFMDYFGINSPEDLPKIKEVLADHLVSPTIVNHTNFDQSETLSVSGTGELVAAGEDGGVADAHSIDPVTLTASNEASAQPDPDATEEGAKEPGAESLEDEIAEEEFISDEIFAAEDEAAEEEKQEQELSGADGVPSEDLTADESKDAGTDGDADSAGEDEKHEK